MKNGEVTENGIYLGPDADKTVDNMLVVEEKKPLVLLFQTDENLCTDINKTGCRFMTLLAMAQFTEQKALDANTIMDIYNESIKDKTVMLGNCTCGVNEHRIINMGFEALGSSRRGRQVNPWTVDKQSELEGLDIDFSIIQWRTLVSGKYGTHFELADKNGFDLYDPGNKVYDKFIRRAYEIDENDTSFDINVKEFVPERYLVYKMS